MQIVFRFTNSETLVVSTYPGGVMLERLDPNEPPKAMESASDQGVSEWRSYWASRSVQDVPAVVAFTKGQARSVASALMQAASEV